MMRGLLASLLILSFTVIGCTQEGSEQQSASDADAEMANAANQNTQKLSPNDSVSAEWQIRLDNPSQKSIDDIVIEDTGKGYHIKTGPRAIFYKSGMTAKAPYTYSAVFTQNNQPGPEAYGLFVGGENLQSDDQGYLYFLIRQTGDYLIKRRVGTDTEMIAGWSSHEAIQSVDEEKKPVNKLTVEASSDTLHFFANGQRLKSMPAENFQYIDGQTGLRINHMLDLTVEDIKLQ